MANTQQKQWLADILESLPSVIFILVWRQGGDLETAGWAGSALALVVLVGFALLLKTRMHPVLLGVNLHILIATPLIVSLFRSGETRLAEVLVSYSYSAVLLTVTGIGLSVFSRAGFGGVADLPRRLRLRLSLLMLAVSAAGAAWALAVPDAGVLPVVITLTGLIAGRRFLLARWADGKIARGEGTGAALAGLSAGAPSAADVSI